MTLRNAVRFEEGYTDNRSNTAVGVSLETFILLLLQNDHHKKRGLTCCTSPGC
jgi:hypothetical protein